MNRFNLSESGPEVSELAYGVWRLADDSEGTSTARVREKIDACLEVGVTTFDHADIYGMYTCEGIFGKALSEAPGLRDSMEIVTKCGIRYPCDQLPDTSVKHYDATSECIEKSVNRSLTELQTDYIDVLLIHRPDWLTSAEETAKVLAKLLEAGKVKSVGVSNYSVHQFDLLSHYVDQGLVTNQLELSALHMDAIYDGTLDQCQRYGVHPMAWSPLSGGRLMSGDDPTASRTHEALKRIGAEYHATVSQTALAWVASLPSRPQIIIGTNSPERIKESARFSDVQLDRQHWYEIWQAAQGNEVP